MANLISGFSQIHSSSRRMLRTSSFKAPTKFPHTPFLQNKIACKHTDTKVDQNSFLEKHDFQLLTDSPKLQWKNLPVTNEWRTELQPYRRAISKIVEPTLIKYCPQNMQSVLEIGSGTFPMIELLPNMAQNLKNQIHLSDINGDVLQFLKTHYPQNTTTFVDILSEKKEDRIYECVVMNDVLNVFSRREIAHACQHIDTILAPGGHLIHFAIREAVFIYTLDEFKEEHLIYFPCVSANHIWEGIYVMQKESFMDFAHSLESKMDDVREMLLEYASLNPIEQDMLGVEGMENAATLNVFRDVGAVIEKYDFPFFKKVLFEEHFHESMQQASDSLNFTTVEFQEKAGQYNGPRSVSHLKNFQRNIFSINRMLREMHYLQGAFSSDIIQEKATIHVFVAQKPY